MGTNFETNTSIMSKDLKEIKKELADCKTAMGFLLADLYALRNMWKGTASTAFFATMIDDKEKVEELLDKYSKGFEKLEISGFSYEKNEKELVDMINSMKL